MNATTKSDGESPSPEAPSLVTSALLAGTWLGLFYLLFSWWEHGLSMGFPLPWTTAFLFVLLCQSRLLRPARPAMGRGAWPWLCVLAVAWLAAGLDRFGGSSALTRDVPLWLALGDFALPLLVISEGWSQSLSIRRRLVAPLAVLILVVPMLWFVSVRMPGSTYEGPWVELNPSEVATEDRLRRDVEHLATTIGARGATDIEGLANARDYLVASVDAMGHQAQITAFEADGETYWNVELEIEGDGSTDEVILVGAHYDVCDSLPGADDNATGVAALLEIARLAGGTKLKRSLKLVFFANEEPPYFGTEFMGSRVRARAMTSNNENVIAMFSLESIGYFREDAGSQRYPFPLGYFYPDKGDFIAFVGNPISGGLVRESIRTFRETTEFPSQGSVLPSFVPGVFWSDHASFWKEGCPAVMVTDTAPFRNPNYHRATDTPETVDFGRLSRVVGGLWELIQETLER